MRPLFRQLFSGLAGVSRTPVRSGGRKETTAKGTVGLGPIDPRALAPLPAPGVRPLIAPFTLRLENDEGELIERHAQSFYLTDHGFRPPFERLAELALSRDPSIQRAIDRRITRAHAAHEMSFRIKDKETGNYDKEFEVPTFGSVVPLRASHVRMLMKSTEPVMRALRALLQRLYSTPAEALSAERLGIAHLPAESRRQIIDSIRESVYFEPKMIDPALADYPFLSVAGFDASVGSLDDPDAVFFEYNLGTPSGLANNIQILEILRETDPEMFAAFGDRLKPLKAFRNLANAVRSNARRWTGNADGISVVVGPGIANGAHPDVASIAMYSGMPLVNPEDLYEDADGHVRLNTGDAAADPIVTGIYSRMEESYFLQDDREGIPVRSPDRHDNAELGERFGVELENGVEYSFRRDEDDEIFGVHTDADGKPIMQKVFGAGLGRDPARPDVEPGSFARLIKGKKLYLSSLGGRVVDDKRVFSAVAEHLAAAYRDPGDETPIAKPPRTLALSEYHELYEGDFARFVVKEPDNSGGQGVHLLCNLSPAERVAIVEKVKNDPERYLVQELRSSSVMMVPCEDGYESTIIDLRMFPTLDADGNVAEDDDGILGRVARPLSASTNTSQGASYGAVAVLDDGETVGPGSVLPEVPVQAHVGASRVKDLVDFLKQLNLVTELMTEAGDESKGAALVLAHFHRQVMDLLGREHAPAMTMARRYAAGEIDRKSYLESLLELRRDLRRHPRFTAPSTAPIVRAHLDARTVPGTIEQVRSRTAIRDGRKALLAKLELEPLAAPVLTSMHDVKGYKLETFETHGHWNEPDPIINVSGYKLAKYETAVYREGADPEIDDAIRRLEACGGELRMVRLKDEESDRWLTKVASARFRVTDDGRPIIGIDMTQDHAIAGLKHELEHFEMWREHRDRFAAQGLSRREAAQAAIAKTNEPELVVEGETRAVEAEMKAELIDSPFNRGKLRAQDVTEARYTSRRAYPQVEGIRDLLHRARWRGETLDEPKLRAQLDGVIRFALANRKAAHEELVDRGRALGRSANQDARIARLGIEADRLRVENPNVFDALFLVFTVDQFRTDDTLDLLRLYFTEAFDAIDTSEYFVDADDADRFRELRETKPWLEQNDADIDAALHAYWAGRDAGGGDQQQ